MSDPRLTLANDRVVHRAIAAEHPNLTPADLVGAFVVTQPVVDLSLKLGGARDRQLLFGYDFAVLEERDGFAFGRSEAACYVGWVPMESLCPKPHPESHTTHVVHTRQTHSYSRADLKTPETNALSMGSRLRVGETQERFAKTEAGWIPQTHLCPAVIALDAVDMAERLLGTPYLWGGDSCFGIDCSGLVHLAFAMAGRRVEGDSDLQRARDGAHLPPNSRFARGDLLFWKGHVALVTDPETIVHANAHHMAVSFEPLHDAIARIEAQGDGPVLAHKRLIAFSI